MSNVLPLFFPRNAKPAWDDSATWPAYIWKADSPRSAADHWKPTSVSPFFTFSVKLPTAPKVISRICFSFPPLGGRYLVNHTVVLLTECWVSSALPAPFQWNIFYNTYAKGLLPGTREQHVSPPTQLSSDSCTSSLYQLPHPFLIMLTGIGNHT